MLAQRSQPVSRNRIATGQIPAPTGGIKATASLAGMAPNECVYSYNLLPDFDGCQPRLGNIEWANGWTGDPAKTVMPFEGNVSGDDKLFICNNIGIWVVTTEGTTSPTKVVSFGTTSGDAGICSFTQFSNDGDARFLLVCDAVNGYYYWTQSSNTWTKAAAGSGTGQINGADPADFNYVVAWKERIWFIEKASGNAWYLPTAQYAGTVASFNFAAQFASGGALVAIANWTVDGGIGVDDYFVVVSTSGDVVIYKGTNPASAATFALVGTWQIGSMPSGARIMQEFAGELYILSIRGAVRASQLLQGNLDNPESYLTSDVGPYLNTCMTEAFDDFGWHMHTHPKTARLYVNAPALLNGEQWGFSYFFGTGAWGMVRGMSKGHTANWRGKVYWVDTEVNKIYQEAGTLDSVYIAPATDGPAQEIQCDVLTAFSTLNSPGLNKRCQILRPTFIAGLTPNYTLSPRYNYDISEVTQGPSTAIGADAGVWNTGVWNVALWGADPTAQSTLQGGGNGMGTSVAVAIRLLTRSTLTLVAFDVVYDAGGPL